MRFEDADVNPKGQPFILLNFSKTNQFDIGTVISLSKDLFELIEQWKKRPVFNPVIFFVPLIKVDG